MKPSTRQWIAIAVLGAMAGTLAACGGGGGGGGFAFIPPAGTAPAETPPAPPAPPAPPPAADAGDIFMAYVKGLLVQLLDTAEPFDVSAFDPPPTTETREPLSTD